MAAKGWTKSKVTKESLLPYISAGVIPEYRHERWRVPAANETEPRLRSGELVFTSFLDRGFTLPTSDFLCQLLAFYNIKISDLARTSSNKSPCSWRPRPLHVGIGGKIAHSLSAIEWSEDEYRKTLANITTATFTSDAGLQPFSEDKPAPKKWQKIANHLPPLTGKEPPKMTEGEEVDEEDDEDEGDRTELGSEARDFVRLPHGAKRGATSSSQSPPEEGAWEEEGEEEMTSPLERKGPAKGRKGSATKISSLRLGI
ncbi:hypothetical protein QYE76_049594 [Lolium multiflorum]|uniref:Transposase (putative) gypsy type domain-containing protein n=1 Tax=Lolium multiflorum TaxID=4521 RepID=A0AAD8WIJ5_LOLMU|nr:hypothetical protein QYE76_049594 [Lolium multiflorum]